jgi:hypothetical protein
MSTLMILMDSKTMLWFFISTRSTSTSGAIILFGLSHPTGPIMSSHDWNSCFPVGWYWILLLTIWIFFSFSSCHLGFLLIL